MGVGSCLLEADASLMKIFIIDKHTKISFGYIKLKFSLYSFLRVLAAVASA